MSRLALLTVVGLFWFSMVATLFQWTYRDARARDSDQQGAWAIGVVAFLPLVLPYYLYCRHRNRGLRDRATPPTRFDRILATWASASLGAVLAGSVLTPPDPFSQIRGTAVALIVTTTAAYLLVYRNGVETFVERISG